MSNDVQLRRLPAEDLAKNFEERPSATEVQLALAKLRVSTSARMSAHHAIECGDGVPLTMLDDRAATTAVMRSTRAAALDD